MEPTFSKTQIDRLGDRLKKDPRASDDLRLLDDYRGTFNTAYESVLQTIRNRGLPRTGRIKTSASILDKLQRESIRLSQMQDIAGCRIVVPDIFHQDRLASELKVDFPRALIIDRRDKPSHGYRAIHIVTEISRKSVEIQIRSVLQHMWAELSEKASDVIDPTIKYGRGPDKWQDTLMQTSKAVALMETLEEIAETPDITLNDIYAVLSAHRDVLPLKESYDEQRLKTKPTKSSLDQFMTYIRKITVDLLHTLLSVLDKLREQN